MQPWGVAFLKTRFREGAADEDTLRIRKVRYVFKTRFHRVRRFVVFKPLGRFAGENAQGIKSGLFALFGARLNEVVKKRCDIGFRSRHERNPTKVQKRDAFGNLRRHRRHGEFLHGHLPGVVKPRLSRHREFRIKSGAHLMNPRLTHIGAFTGQHNFVGIHVGAHHVGGTDDAA